MKGSVNKKSLFALIIFSCVLVRAQQMNESSRIPTVTLNVLHQVRYPNSQEVNWNKIENSRTNSFECIFLFNDVKYTVVYSSEEVIQQESSVQRLVPKSIKRHLEVKYSEYELIDFSRVRDFENGKVNYIANIMYQGIEKMQLVYDKDYNCSADTE
jgi:hypothetical protein